MTQGKAIKMTLSRAIEILTFTRTIRANFTEAELNKAERLGIEALKRVTDLRKERGLASCYLLPGETEE